MFRSPPFFPWGNDPTFDCGGNISEAKGRSPGEAPEAFRMLLGFPGEAADMGPSGVPEEVFSEIELPAQLITRTKPLYFTKPF
jgi:hypothetical protein